MLTLYGLKTCDTCRKALSALEAAGVAVTFVDVRAEADLPALLPGWLAAAGPKTLVNTRSTTWRGLAEADKAQASAADTAAILLAAHPALIKRPVIVTENGGVHVGWTADTRAALGV